MRQAVSHLPCIRRHWSLGWCGLLLLLMALSLLPTGKADAQISGCMLDNTSPAAQGTTSFSLPSTITVAANTAIGTVLATSTATQTNPVPVYDCAGTVPYGIVNNVGTTPGNGVSEYPTGIPGISYEIVRGGNTLYSYPNTTLSTGLPGCTYKSAQQAWNCPDGTNAYQFSVTTQLSLVVTGPISNSTVPAGVLGYWQWQALGSGGATTTAQIVAFSLANAVNIVINPSCSVNTNPVNVTLPTIITSALGGTGTTAGTTPFAIALTCPSGAAGATLSIQLDYNGTASGIQGVLAPTGGTSAGVGVQVLNQSSNPVTFGTPQTVGTISTGATNISFFARYYQTGTVTPGTLQASATFTLLYQ
jgi:type 1 fimbria pilin